MNIKEQINFIAIQEHMITLLIKAKAMESILVEKNICTLDEYNGKLKEITELVAKDLKPVYDQIKQFTDALKQQTEQLPAAETKE